MSQCRDENESDLHGHGHSHGDHDHDHDHDGPDRGAEQSLFSQINQENVRCLNESEPGAGKKVIKPWHERNDTTKVWVTIFRYIEIQYIIQDHLNLICISM